MLALEVEVEVEARTRSRSRSNLNMKKCVYLMAPVQSQISQSEMNVRIHALVNLGIPIGNVKIHPECQPCVSPSVFIK